MRVRNLNGTSDTTCKCGNWLNHWVNYNTGGQSKPTYCCVNSCYGTDLVGGHVQKDSYLDNSWYIIPICKSCNNLKGQDLYISDSTALAPANKSITCEKR